jgi:hypothetical protein
MPTRSGPGAEPAALDQPAPSPAVHQVFLSYPPGIRAKLVQLRERILTTASSIDAVGPVTETLKWGEPAYLTEQSKSGSTIRIGWKAAAPTQYAVYFNCQTSLVDTFRTLFPELNFVGSRALVLDEADELPVA